MTLECSSTGVLTVSFLGILIAITMFFDNTMEPKPGVVPFTRDEWIWAAQDGYLGTMLGHFLRNGGL